MVGKIDTCLKQRHRSGEDGHILSLSTRERFGDKHGNRKKPKFLRGEGRKEPDARDQSAVDQARSLPRSFAHPFWGLWRGEAHRNEVGKSHQAQNRKSFPVAELVERHRSRTG